MRVHGGAGGDTVIVNTCAVTAEAERQARQAIRRLRRERPNARIVVTGCAAQINPDRFAAMPEVDHVLGNTEKLVPGAFAGPLPVRVAVSDLTALSESAPMPVAGFEGRSRAFVEIQQGCDHRCTYCVIPFGRGPNRSVAPERVIAQIRTLVDEGYAEVILTGVDLTSYHGGLGPLVRRILAEVGDLARLRLSSVDPAAVDDVLLDVLADDQRLMPHLHLSAQAGDDLILKRMARRHTRADIIALAGRLRGLRPGLTLGADLIAGFPTEDEAMFQRSLDLIDEAGLTHLHVFRFSPRPGTPAAKMPPVPKPQVKDRAARLRAKADTAMDALLERRIGKSVRVLVERDHQGHCEHALPVRLTTPVPPGVLLTARVLARAAATLIAREVDDD